MALNAALNIYHKSVPQKHIEMETNHCSDSHTAFIRVNENTRVSASKPGTWTRGKDEMQNYVQSQLVSKT